MTDRVIAITGGHGVLGRAVAEAALACGLKVAIIDHAPGQSVPEGVLQLAGVDLTDPASAQTAIDTVAAHFGGLDALLNIAGGFVWQTTDHARHVLNGRFGPMTPTRPGRRCSPSTSPPP